MEDENSKEIKEAIESAYEQIHYYSNLPKHIKGSALNLNCTSNEQYFQCNQPTQSAHVVEGTTTVINGKLNMPSVSLNNSFQNTVYL